MFLKRRFWGHWSLNSVGELCRTMSKGLAIGSIAILLAACGDDSGSSSGPSDSASESDLVVATYDDLPVCSSKREGATAYVKDEKTAYVCESRNWKEDSENDSEPVEVSSSSKAKSSSSKKSSSSSSASKSKSSSSVSKTVLSSSVEKSKSSSSATPESSSSSSQTVVLSSDSHEKSSGSSFNGWSWDVPKEARLNPEIAYGTMTDSRDKKVYKTVKIGDQVWMAENLNYADSTKTPSLKGKSWCFDNDSLKCGVTGRLYTWTAAIDSVKLATDADNPQDCGYRKTCTLPAKVQGICPTGWHLPTNAEWHALFTAVGGQSTAGKVLKSQSGWVTYRNGTDAFGFSTLPRGNGTDAFGFSALPAGERDTTGRFDDEGYDARFWSSAEYDRGYAYYMDLYYFTDEYATLGFYNKGDGYSVRCLKD